MINWLLIIELENDNLLNPRTIQKPKIVLKQMSNVPQNLFKTPNVDHLHYVNSLYLKSRSFEYHLVY